ncbi:MAG: hypothetical protein HKO67_06205 [Flavobacteriaceae bacterium]|nr:hypothetical protein [Flavobacteriaceae bacterium]
MKHGLHIISIALSMLIFFQSCATYTGNYTLDQAATEQRKAKVTSVDERVSIYEKIDTLNGEFIGISEKRNQLQNEVLKEDQVRQVQLIDEVQTKKKNKKLIGISVGAVLGAVLLAVLVSNIKVGLPDMSDEPWPRDE